MEDRRREMEDGRQKIEDERRKMGVARQDMSSDAESEVGRQEAGVGLTDFILFGTTLREFFISAIQDFRKKRILSQMSQRDIPLVAIQS